MGTEIASGTGVPTITGRACSRRCQGEGDKRLSPLQGKQGPFQGSHTPLWALGEWVGERERRQQRRLLTRYFPERWLTGAQAAQAQPRQPKDGADSGLPGLEEDLCSRSTRGTEAENEIGVSRASCMELRSSSTANLHPAFQPHHPQTPGGFHAYRDHCGHLKSNSKVERHCDKSKGFEIR